jgi:hypothetical protein
MQMTSGKRALDKIYKRRDRYEIPDWQREEVWDRTKKQQLVDSILRGWKLPKFYFVKITSDPDEYEVVDGQQRLTAIFEFFANELSLSKEAAKEFGGEYYRDLPATYSDNFDDFEIEYDEIEDADDSELKKFFQRLQDGLPLTSSEKLNSVHSKLRDFCRELSRHKFFAEKVTIRDKRYAHFDVVAKVAAIEIEGLDVGLRYDDLKDIFESQIAFSPKSNVAQRLRQTFDYLYDVFPERNPLLKNRTILQSLATLAARIASTDKGAGYEGKLYDFFTHFMKALSHQVELGQNATDQDYINFQKSVSANVRSGAHTRHEILLRKMLIFDPIFSEILGPEAVAESGLTKRIRELGDSIVTLVSQVNSEYAAKHGVDLIKPTNKTTTALNKIGKAIQDYSDYQDLIDDLYFTFHEGTGSRITDKKPESFVDVNDLRTELQHDLDHGGEGKAAAKRMKVSAAFRKYAGVNTPATLSPDRFPVVQASLLGAIDGDLRELLAELSKK